MFKRELLGLDENKKKWDGRTVQNDHFKQQQNTNQPQTKKT